MNDEGENKAKSSEMGGVFSATPEAIKRVAYALANAKELRLLAQAEEGRIEILAKYIEDGGLLLSIEARRYVASRLRGEPQKRGRKQLHEQRAREFEYLGRVLRIKSETGCSEYAARNIILAEEANLKAETLKTYLRRARMRLGFPLSRGPSTGASG